MCIKNKLILLKINIINLNIYFYNLINLNKNK